MSKEVGAGGRTDIFLDSALSEFKRKIKKWDRNSCIRRLCDIYVRNLGFL